MAGDVGKLLLSSVMVIGLFMGIVYFIGQGAPYYSVDSEIDTNTTMYRNFNNMTTLSENVRDKISSTTLGGDWLNVPLVVVAGSYETLKLMLQLPNIMGTFITGLSESLSLPAWTGTMLMLIIGLIVSLAIVKAIFKVEL